jgi:hypothetical protein
VSLAASINSLSVESPTEQVTTFLAPPKSNNLQSSTGNSNTPGGELDFLNMLDTLSFGQVEENQTQVITYLFQWRERENIIDHNELLGQLNQLIGPVEGHNWNKGSLTLAVTFLGATFPVDGHDRLTLSAVNLEMSDKASVADTLLHSYNIRVTKSVTSHDFDLLRVLTFKTLKYCIIKFNILISYIFKINIVNFPPNVQQEDIKEAMKEKGFPEQEILQLTFRMKGMYTNPQMNKQFSKYHNADINKLKQKENPDIIFIIESHTFYEEYNKIKQWLEDKQYKIIYKADSQRNQYEILKTQKIKEIDSMKHMSLKAKEIEKNNWIANTKIYQMKYAGGIILLIKAEILNNFKEITIIPNNRGITIMNKNKLTNNNILLIILYMVLLNKKKQKNSGKNSKIN